MQRRRDRKEEAAESQNDSSGQGIVNGDFEDLPSPDVHIS